MTFKAISSLCFIFYGFSLPFFASDFTWLYPTISLLIFVCCFVVAAIVYFCKPTFLNLLLAFYVFKVYLTRPYVGLFTDKLVKKELAYIESLNYFFTPVDARTVYMSLLSLLVCWLMGLQVGNRYKKSWRSIWPIFLRTDDMVLRGSWLFAVTWIVLAFLNYSSPMDQWMGMRSTEASALFAYGLLSTATIDYVCLFCFLRYRKSCSLIWRYLLLVPVTYGCFFGISSGSRSYMFVLFSYIILYTVFLHQSLRFKTRHLLLVIYAMAIIPVVILAGIVAQSLRKIYRYGPLNQEIGHIFSQNSSVFDLSNLINRSIFFDISELLSRLSSLKAQFLILNDKFVVDPMQYMNPVMIGKRIINDLVPGQIFSDILSMNQTFDFIYFLQLSNYNSETWSVQGLLYLFFGFALSMPIVLLISFFIGQSGINIDKKCKESPAYAVFWGFLFVNFIEHGLIERLVTVDVVRPLAGLFAVVFLVHLFRTGRLRFILFRYLKF